jgi:eukaryotic-like serine/threonine-protein kinase
LRGVLGTDDQFGRYRLTERIAVGGMGEVFLARYLTAAGIERLAVVKRILPHLSKNQKFVDYFLNEGRITSLFCHPNVVQTLELGRTAGQYYIAMEHIPGQTLVRLLATAMRMRQSLSIPLIHSLATQIVSALDYIHELANLEGDPLKIIHMDLAPHNILVTPDGQAKLLDFGISSAAGLAEGPAQPDFRGRTAYLAPEQIDGLSLDRRVDIFAMGVILHEMVLARPLFRSRADRHTATRILYAPIPGLRAGRSDCPEMLEEIVLTALERDRERRYQQAFQMHEDLETMSQAYSIVSNTQQMRAELARLMSGAELEVDAAEDGSLTGEPFAPLASTTLD